MAQSIFRAPDFKGKTLRMAMITYSVSYYALVRTASNVDF